LARIIADALTDISRLAGVSGSEGLVEFIPGHKIRIAAKVTTREDVGADSISDRAQMVLANAVAGWVRQARLRAEHSSQIASFLDRARRLEDQGLIDSAMDLVHDSIDELLRRGQFALCDSVLNEIDPAQYSADVLLALLTSTAPARSKLSTRRKFFRSVTKTLKERKEYERGLLDGLG
jgi:hypothetical protein